MTAYDIQSGTICTQVGPNEYCRTPVTIKYPQGPFVGGTPPTVQTTYGTPVYSSTPCGSNVGENIGDSLAAPSSAYPPSIGPGLIFTLSQIAGPIAYDPGCGLWYGYTPVAYQGQTVSVCVWGASPNAASWSSTPPPRNSMTDGTWYNFPTTRKWVVVGDGIFRSISFGRVWEKRQDWVNTPHRCFYANSGLLVGCIQTVTGVSLVGSLDDGRTWSVFYVIPAAVIAPGSQSSVNIPAKENPANYQADAPYAYAANLGIFAGTGSQIMAGVASGAPAPAPAPSWVPGCYLLTYGLRPDVNGTAFGWTLGTNAILFTAELGMTPVYFGEVPISYGTESSSPFTLASGAWSLGLRGRW